MKLANPIYDAAFKYLLEDSEIAKGLISRIIGEEIVELSLKPQEIKVKSEKYVVIILRIDFKATIKTKEGTYKKVLIEIQKGKDDKDVLRFRRYLGVNYRQVDTVKTDVGEEEKKVLPIITIYFLGFRLASIKTPVVKVDRTYTDLVTNEQFTQKEAFIEQLTHDGYFIQIPRLHKRDRNDLERVLKVFNQSYKWEEDSRLMEISQQELNKDPLLKKIGERLLKAASNEEILAKMDVEEEVEERIEKHLRENALLKEKNEQKDLVIEQKDLALEEKDLALEEKELELKSKEIELVKQLILYTEFADAKIAQLQGVSIEFVKKLRKETETED